MTSEIGPRTAQVDPAATIGIPGSRRLLDHRYGSSGHQGDVGDQFVGRVTFCRRFTIGNDNPPDRTINMDAGRRFSSAKGCGAQNCKDCHRD